ncbi:MAG: PGPGW domain-containing protein [Phycisphaeraceae bacterium]
MTTTHHPTRLSAQRQAQPDQPRAPRTPLAIRPIPKRWRTPKWVRRIVIGIIGTTILILGGILFILPLPLGWIILPLGLVTLATEFVWARHLLKKIRAQHRVLDASINTAEQHAKTLSHTLLGPDDDRTAEHTRRKSA